jgi:hypothetical protein
LADIYWEVIVVMPKTIGNWEVKRASDQTPEKTPPSGIGITGEFDNVEDLLDSITLHKVLLPENKLDYGDEVVVRCCTGNTAVA